jgi:hypothetical protein
MMKININTNVYHTQIFGMPFTDNDFINVLKRYNYFLTWRNEAMQPLKVFRAWFLEIISLLSLKFLYFIMDDASATAEFLDSLSSTSI